jgi:hypothetical protein
MEGFICSIVDPVLLPWFCARAMIVAGQFCARGGSGGAVQRVPYHWLLERMTMGMSAAVLSVWLRAGAGAAVPWASRCAGVLPCITVLYQYRPVFVPVPAVLCCCCTSARSKAVCPLVPRALPGGQPGAVARRSFETAVMDYGLLRKCPGWGFCPLASCCCRAVAAPAPLPLRQVQLACGPPELPCMI